MSIRGIKSAPAVATPATTDALLVQQSDGVARYATAAQLLSLGAGSAATAAVFGTPSGIALSTTEQQIPFGPVRDPSGLVSNNNVNITVAGEYRISGRWPAVDAGSTGAPSAGTQIGIRFYATKTGAIDQQWSTAGNAHTTARFDFTAELQPGDLVALYASATAAATMQAAQFLVTLVIPG